MTYRAILENAEDSAPGQIDARVRYTNGSRERVRDYSLKGPLANRHSLRAVVEDELAGLNAAESEAALLSARVGGEVTTFACGCGLAGCPQTGNHWLRPPG